MFFESFEVEILADLISAYNEKNKDFSLLILPYKFCQWRHAEDVDGIKT